MEKPSEEMWKKIDGYNHWISSFGRVKSKTKILIPQNNLDGYYQVCLSKNGKTKTKQIHRLVANNFIINHNNYPHVDHIDRNKHNNNITNLRFVNRSANGINSNISKSNTSGYKGVYWHKKRNKWMASIRINGRNKNVGYYIQKIDAINARKKVEEEYWKNFNLLNNHA